jgi:hypothetical protein
MLPAGNNAKQAEIKTMAIKGFTNLFMASVPLRVRPVEPFYGADFDQTGPGFFGLPIVLGIHEVFRKLIFTSLQNPSHGITLASK